MALNNGAHRAYRTTYQPHEMYNLIRQYSGNTLYQMYNTKGYSQYDGHNLYNFHQVCVSVNQAVLQPVMSPAKQKHQ